MKYNYPTLLSRLKILLAIPGLSKNPIPYHRKWLDNYGDSISFVVTSIGKVILTRDINIAKQVLQKDHKLFQKSEIQSVLLSNYIGHGLLTSNGEYWLKQRRLIQPAFHKKKIENLVRIISDTIDDHSKNIPTDEFIDAYESMHELAFNVIAKSLFTNTVSNDKLKTLKDSIDELQGFIVKDLRVPYYKLFARLTGRLPYYMGLVQQSRDILQAIISNRRKSTEEFSDLLDMLIHAEYEDGSTMSDTQLIDEILILFVAGHETTANALSFSLKLIAQHPEVLDKLKKECDHLEEKKYSLFERLMHSPYTKACLEESLRLYPPAWLTDRENLEDIQLGKDYIVKAGTITIVSIYEIHRNSDYWDEPNSFIPTRFLPENRQKSAPYFMPFGAGPRLCIGNNFAMYEMILTLQSIIKRYDFISDNTPIKVSPLVTLKPVGVKIKCTKR